MFMHLKSVQKIDDFALKDVFIAVIVKVAVCEIKIHLIIVIVKLKIPELPKRWFIMSLDCNIAN